VARGIASPIVIDENGDITVYSSAEQARRSLEAIDVRDNAYEAFDATGLRLVLTAEGDVVLPFIPDETVPDPSEVADRLRQFITRVGPHRYGLQYLRGASLAALLAVLVER
jgi:hypothetical protein